MVNNVSRAAYKAAFKDARWVWRPLVQLRAAGLNEATVGVQRLGPAQRKTSSLSGGRKGERDQGLCAGLLNIQYYPKQRTTWQLQPRLLKEVCNSYITKYSLVLVRLQKQCFLQTYNFLATSVFLVSSF